DRIARRLEAGGFDHLGGDWEALGDLVGVVGVAAVLHGLPPHLAPPANHRDVRAEKPTAGGVHLEHTPCPRGGAQDGADLRLEILLPIRRSVLWPVALRIVEVRERLEGLAALDHGQDLSEVVPACRSKVDTRTFPQLARVDRLAAELDAVDRTQNVVEASRPKNRRRLFREPVGFAELDSAQDPQPGEPGAASIDGVEITYDVDAVLVWMHLHKVGVVGESDRGQTQLDRPFAAALHGSTRAVV